MILLAIDTCDSRGSISVLGGGRVVATAVHETGEPYSSWIFAEVPRLVESTVGGMSAIEAYAVASGPGSFTGLRVGLTAVKAWGELYKRPVIPISRLEAVAVQSRSTSRLVAPFLDASRGQLFGGLYRKERERLALVGEEMVGSPQELMDWVLSQAEERTVSWISPDAQLLGNSRKGLAAIRIEVEPASIQLAPIIGNLAIQRFERGMVTDALHLDANYIRRSDAEILWKGPGVDAKLRR